jgi:hypothetical protein
LKKCPNSTDERSIATELDLCGHQTNEGETHASLLAGFYCSSYVFDALQMHNKIKMALPTACNEESKVGVVDETYYIEK